MSYLSDPIFYNTLISLTQSTFISRVLTISPEIPFIKAIPNMILTKVYIVDFIENQLGFTKQ